MLDKKQIYIFLTLILFLNSPIHAQFSEGFNKKEAKDMIAICNSFSFIKTINSDKSIIPKGYKKIYESGSVGLDNKWQLWSNNKYAIINLRGSTSEQISWLENMYSAMIPATGEITLPGNEIFNYKLAQNPKANIHSGWTLATAFLAKDIIQHIKMLNYEGVYHFIITGHSQGAAIAQLLRSYLENTENIINKKNRFKTYAFASPMVGNKFFSTEYSENFSSSSFIINNVTDPIINTPFTIDKRKMLDPRDIETLMDSSKNIFKTLAFRAVEKIIFSNPDSAYIEKAGTNIHRQISKKIGPFKMPKYQLDMTYTPVSNPILIGPFSEKNFIKKKYYKKFDLDSKKIFYQHKPYLYYLEILRRYFPTKFKKW